MWLGRSEYKKREKSKVYVCHKQYVDQEDDLCRGERNCLAENLCVNSVYALVAFLVLVKKFYLSCTASLP